jgi:nicotinate-nucleotide pyrophosphorylase (carboxylating)
LPGTEVSVSQQKQLIELIKHAFAEDMPVNDITTDTIIKDPGKKTAGKAISKGNYIVSGIEIARLAYSVMDESIRFNTVYKDGDPVKKGKVLFDVHGPVSSLLKAERTVLNILSHMMGIASKTDRIVKKTAGTGVTILDTRKTLPGLRYIQKMAVVHGGGKNHRYSLSDAVLIKENHIEAAGSIVSALQAFSGIKKDFKIEIEVKNLKELKEALSQGPDIIMLDNMDIKTIKEAVRINNKRAKLEVSGGINEKTVLKYARTGVDFISIGALTHSVEAADISFLFEGLA